MCCLCLFVFVHENSRDNENTFICIYNPYPALLTPPVIKVPPPGWA